MKSALPSRFTFTLSALALSIAASSAAQAQEELNFYNWSDYIAEETIERFEKETGIKVTYDVYDSNETLEAKLLAGNSGYDLVVPTSHFMELQIKAGIFLPIDKTKLPNYKHLDASLMETLGRKDPGNQYGIPYLWGTTGIGYNPAQVAAALGEDAPVNSWDLVFKPEYMAKLQDCGVTFLDSPDEMIPFAQLYAGKDPNSHNVADFKPNADAAKVLKGVRPYVKQFHSSQYVNDLANGDSCVAVGFSGDVFQAAARAEEANNGVEVKYSIPKEGSEIWFDMLVIPKDAPNAENAHKFINYLLRPDVIAEITNYVWYANPNKDATALVDKEITSDPAIYPDEATMNNLYISSQVPPKIAKVRNRLWAEIKRGK
ncbi:polyamine ABC transporter substrate-binding protein [Neptunomonas marina]|uniref:Putrescine-binding periplasmic protein n=1 Tax=Neptunomonas marina TaxID=1815562 RepID=A0A437Q527_9GAMM|nr:polyamine ABC transporter substrate-binding protein [Neptunomonas marina]RVU29601.1 polyamine ABC transporter substrate-binding protein [Neptunomonas marina]